MRNQPHLIHVFPSFALGGQSIRTVLLANALGARFRHTFIALDGDFAAAETLSPEAPSSCLAVLPPKSGRLRPGAIAAFRNLLAAQAPDILVTYNWGAVEWAFANRFFPLCPHLHFEDGFGPDENPSKQIPRRVWFRRVALTGNSVVVVPSLTLRTIATERWGLSPGRVLYVPNGIDCARFARPEGAPKRGRLRVGSVGRLRAEKNFGRLLRVAAVARRSIDFDLELVGDGPERGALERLARELDLSDSVRFFGDCRRPEERYREFDVFALSSDTEQMPFSLLESMAAGLPAAATDVGDIRAILPPENGPFLSAPEDERGFADRLVRLLGDGALRASLGAANLARVRAEYSMDRMVAVYDELFSRLAAQSPKLPKSA